MITDEKLNEWKRLLSESTPGPWARYGGSPPNVGTNASYKSLNENRQIYDEKGDIFATYLGVCNSCGYEANWLEEWKDLAFIAASREAVPELIDEVERLRKIINDNGLKY